MQPDIRKKVLIVDDEPYIREFLGEVLSSEFQVSFAQNGKVAIEVVKRSKPAIIVLDLIMPEMGGIKLCEVLKNDSDLQEIPVVILSAIDDPKVRMEAFSLGVADYIQKPFHPEELLLRVKSKVATKPPEDISQSPSKADDRVFGNLVLSMVSRSIRVKTREKQLFELEAQILEYLMDHVGQICPRDEIAERLWPSAGSSTTRNLDPHISSLRKKLKGADYSIQTVYGTGYIFKK